MQRDLLQVAMNEVFVLAWLDLEETYGDLVLRQILVIVPDDGMSVSPGP